MARASLRLTNEHQKEFVSLGRDAHGEYVQSQLFPIGERVVIDNGKFPLDGEEDWNEIYQMTGDNVNQKNVRLEMASVNCNNGFVNEECEFEVVEVLNNGGRRKKNLSKNRKSKNRKSKSRKSRSRKSMSRKSMSRVRK